MAALQQRTVRRDDYYRLGVSAVEIAASVLALAFFFLSGASATLAEGVTARIGAEWLSRAVFLVTVLFGYAVLMFPFRCYRDLHLDRNRPPHPFRHWVVEYIQTVPIPLLLGVLFFDVTYRLMAAFPAQWWLPAGLIYSLFGVLFQWWLPKFLMSKIPHETPVHDTELVDRMKVELDCAGINLSGAFINEIESDEPAGHLQLAGFGKTRTLLLERALLKKYPQDEIIALLVRELCALRQHATGLLLAVETLFTLVTFRVLAAGYRGLIGAVDLTPTELAAVPLLAGTLLITQLLLVPLSNAVSRLIEFRLDRETVHRLPCSRPFIYALIRTARLNHTDMRPAAWLEIFTRNTPSVRRRNQCIQSYSRRQEPSG